MSNPNITRTRGGKHYDRSGRRKSDDRTIGRLKPKPEATVTADHCRTALLHADEVYIADPTTGEIIGCADDRSLTNTLGLRWRKPEIETEPVPFRQYDHELGRMVAGTNQRMTWRSDATLLNRGTFRNTETRHLKRRNARSKQIEYGQE